MEKVSIFMLALDQLLFISPRQVKRSVLVVGDIYSEMKELVIGLVEKPYVT
jgi:hypothetical protein